MSSPGDLMGGRYRLTERIAVGGMGEVWQARDEILGRSVAIKVLKDGLTDEEGFTDRFRNEARLSAALAHGNIAQVYDYGEDGTLAYLVMEYVPGKPLSTILRERVTMSAADTAGLISQAASALHAAHRAGLIHRDVKPANMLVTPDGVVKLTDFGIARAVGSAAMTRTGEVMGTAQYMAPEAAMGRETTALTDVYSLAVVTYEMLGGRRPFVADSAVALALQHVNEPPPPLPEQVPAPVRAIVHAALEKDPGLRPNSAFEFGRALRQAVADSQQMGLDPFTPAPRPQLSNGSGATSGPNPAAPSGPQPGATSGPQSAPLSGSQIRHSTEPAPGTRSAARTGAPEAGGHTAAVDGPKTRTAKRASRGDGTGDTATGSDRRGSSSHASADTRTGPNTRVLLLAVAGVVVLIAVVVGVVLGMSGGKSDPATPTPTDTGPFSSSVNSYSPQQSTDTSTNESTDPGGQVTGEQQ